ICVIGSIYFGVVTPTEAGAMGAFAAFVIALSMRRLTANGILGALERTLKSTAMILTIVIGAMIFGYYLTATQLTQGVVEWVQNTGVSKWVVLAIVLLLYILLGMFMD